MRILLKEELQEKVSISHSFGELLHNLNYSTSHNVRLRLKKLITKYSIDISHFDSHYHNKQKALPTKEKQCLFCGNNFITKVGNKRERKYCSHLCANTPNIGKRRSKELNEQVSKKLTKPPLEKFCLFCNKSFSVSRDRNKIKFCSTSCGSKYNWSNPKYVNNHSKQIIERVKNGKFGWRSRKELSFPEQVYKKLLEDNGFKDRFIINHPIKKDELNEIKGHYYLDFYFPEFNLDLEIDGQQHKRPQNILSDNIRDSFLSIHYTILRIEWREITTKNGKSFLKEQQQKLLDFLNNFR